MEKGLKWEHGVQFVCLAFQNAAANLIEGYTIHNWAGIARNATETRSREKAQAMYAKCLALRVLIIDEVSMVEASLLGMLDWALRTAASPKNCYKKREDDSCRAFAGVNTIFLGDFLQLPPVGGGNVASDPTTVPLSNAKAALDIFWETNLDTIRHFWELTEPMRCMDPWYGNVLNECRHGNLTTESYCYLHGLPTLLSPGFRPTLLPSGERCTCNAVVIHDDPVVGPYNLAWKEEFLAKGRNMQEFLSSADAECGVCRKERHRRHISITEPSKAPARIHAEHFTTATALYNYNVPRFYCIFLRAREFAKQNNKELSWCYAVDVPVNAEVDKLSAEGLKAKRLRWLQRHDQHTAHMPSKYALAVGMPVVLTNHVDRDRQLFKNTKGFIHSWVLDQNYPQEREEFDGEFLLNRLPAVVYIRFPGKPGK